MKADGKGQKWNEIEQNNKGRNYEKVGEKKKESYN